MKDNTDYMDKAIKEKFEGHEVSVPSHLWNSIESNLPPRSNNTGGGFFFTNSFMLSILFISTVLVGTYVYQSSTKKTNDTTDVASITTNSQNKLNSDSSSYSKSISDNYSLTKETNKSIGALSNSIPTIDSEEKAQTSITSTKIQSEVATNLIRSKKNQLNPISTKNNTENSNNNNQGISQTPTNTLSTEKKYLPQTQNKNIKKQDINNNNNNNVNTNQTDKTDFSINSTKKAFPKETNNNSNSASTLSNTESHSFESINNPSSINTNTQAPNITTSENSEGATVHVDSAQNFASAFMQESDSYTKIESSDPITLANNNVLTDKTKTNNTLTASSSNQELQVLQIGSTSAISNSTSNLIKPSENGSAYNQDMRNNETTDLRSASTNTQVVSSTNTNNSKISSENSSLDSVNKYTPLENELLSSSTTDYNNSITENKSTAELLLLKNDSLLTGQLDTLSEEKQPESIEVKSSEKEKNKKSLFLSRCSFDGYATPALGYLHLSPNLNQESISESTKERNKNASTGFGITTGLRANYALSQKIEIGIGFQYSSLSQHSSFIQSQVDSSYITYQGHNQIDSTYDPIRDTTIFTSHYVVTDSATINLTSSNVKSYTDTYQNFSIPIHIAYGYSITNKLSLLARTSLLINYQTSSTTYLNGSDSTIIGYHSNKNLSLGGSFSIGCYYQFAKRYSVFAEPIVTYYFSNVFDKQVPFKQTQLMLGLQTGIRLSF